ncbi:MAG: WbqC family protein [Flavobacteriales bacterium]|nr:WbqC family protein [Flavobacteriales bacterium]
MLAVLPLCCFPPIHWCALALKSEHVLIDIHEHYPKQTFRNRYEIPGANGKMVLTIPVVGQKGQKIPFNEIQLADGNWRKQHFLSLKSTYQRSAFFEYYEDEVKNIFSADQKFLIGFNLDALLFVENIFGKRISGQFTVEYIENFDVKDFRNEFEPSVQWTQLPTYPQVFGDRLGFVNNVSVLDLIFNLGPGARDYMINT